MPVQWWERRWSVVLLALLSTIPLLYPKIPPLVDLFGHMGRYRVQLDIDHSPWLHLYYGFHWAMIGNLGVDLLVMPLGELLGLEPAVKLIVLAIPPLTVGGFLWVAREVHGRIPPTALFALPFVYSHPFMFGFVNFVLSVALAFLAFGLWLRLGRLGKLQLRSALFVPISLIVFFTHTFGWGMLGLLCFSAEAVRQHDSGRGWLRSAVNAVLHASVMGLPIVITLVWRSEAHGGMTADWFNWMVKWQWLVDSFRDHWRGFDIGSLCVVGLVLAFALFSRALTFSRNLLFTAIVLLLFYLLLPRTVFGSAYADMRLIPYAVATLVLAVRFRRRMSLPVARTLAVLGLAFFLVRIGGNTLSLAIAANDQEAKLTALGHVPDGARVVTLSALPCTNSWSLPRNSHLGSMVIVRRQGFANDQWVLEGLNTLELKYTRAGYYSSDPSELVRPNNCRDGLHRQLNTSLSLIPRDDFDYIWLLDPPPYDERMTAGMQPVWRGAGSILYRLHP